MIESLLTLPAHTYTYINPLTQHIQLNAFRRLAPVEEYPRGDGRLWTPWAVDTLIKPVRDRHLAAPDVAVVVVDKVVVILFHLPYYFFTFLTPYSMN